MGNTAAGHATVFACARRKLDKARTHIYIVGKAWPGVMLSLTKPTVVTVDIVQARSGEHTHFINGTKVSEVR